MHKAPRIRLSYSLRSKYSNNYRMDSVHTQQGEKAAPPIIMTAAPTVWSWSFSGLLTADLVTRASHIAENSTGKQDPSPPFHSARKLLILSTTSVVFHC